MDTISITKFNEYTKNLNNRYTWKFHLLIHKNTMSKISGIANLIEIIGFQ